ncbi:MAG: DNA repair protein RecO [Chloroflexia bacterium]|jgi:DNA repair protein RecO (recombination protein O)|nr:DNA repair protein RecO [Chloroflexia bacterium]
MPDSIRNRLYSTEAIVLARRNLGESDRICDVYSVRYGKLSVIAKRARRSDNRDGRSLDLLSRVLIHLYRGRNLDIVKSVEPVASHDGLRADLDAYGHACYLAELVRAMTEDRQPNEQLYSLLAQCLTLLSERVDPWPVTRYFEYALLDASGFQAQLYACAHCRDPLSAQVNAFSVRESGILCPKCQVHDPGAAPLSVNAQKYLRAMDREGLRRTIGLHLDEASRNQVQHMLTNYLQHLAERPLASLGVLRSMRGKVGVATVEGELGPAVEPARPSA